MKYGKGRPGRFDHVWCHQVPDGTTRDQILVDTWYMVDIRRVVPNEESRLPYFILEAMKYWRWERPGNEAADIVVVTVVVINL